MNTSICRSNREHSTVDRAAAALGATITIDDKGLSSPSFPLKLTPDSHSLPQLPTDVFNSGIVVTTICALIALLSLLYFLLTLLSRSPSTTTTTTPRSRGPALGTRTLPLQSLTLGFSALWLFATQIAFTDFVAKREAGISATIGGVSVPESLVQATEAQLGLTSVYRRISYRTSSFFWRTCLLLLFTLTRYFFRETRNGEKCACSRSSPGSPSSSHLSLPQSCSSLRDGEPFRLLHGLPLEDETTGLRRLGRGRREGRT